MSSTEAKIQAYIEKHQKHADILNKLRALILTTDVSETIKWGQPTYTVNNKNVMGIGAFKNHAGLWFFQGALLNDKNNLLINAQEGKTKALRQLKVSNVNDINEEHVLLLIEQAIENEKKGLSVKIERKKSVNIPSILIDEFEKNPELKKKFEQLTPGKQREFSEHINEAKREITKEKRLDKIIPMILNGVGLYDKYKNC